MNKSELFIEEYRNLSLEEIGIIQWLLAEHDRLELANQLDNVKVISKCGCGCRTIGLQVESEVANSQGLHLSAQGFSPEGVPIDVILHIRNGLIYEFEVYAMDGTEKFTLPETEKLHI
jgi:hypothetical protein